MSVYSGAHGIDLRPPARGVG